MLHRPSFCCCRTIHSSAAVTAASVASLPPLAPRNPSRRPGSRPDSATRIPGTAAAGISACRVGSFASGSRVGSSGGVVATASAGSFGASSTGGVSSPGTSTIASSVPGLPGAPSVVPKPSSRENFSRSGRRTIQIARATRRSVWMARLVVQAGLALRMTSSWSRTSCQAVGSSGSPEGSGFDSLPFPPPEEPVRTTIAAGPLGAGGSARVAQGTLPTIVPSAAAGVGACGGPAGGRFGVPGSPGGIGVERWAGEGAERSSLLFRFRAETGNPGGVGKVFRGFACGGSDGRNGSHFTSAFHTGMIRSLSGGPPADDTFPRRSEPKPSG